MIRSWDAGSLLLKRDALDARAIARLRACTDQWQFDPVYYPGMRADEANSHHVLARDEPHAGAPALLSAHPQPYLDAYTFAITPAGDDRPYFGNFFKWATLPALWRQLAK